MGRHKAREEALKILYAIEIAHKDVEEALKEAFEFCGKNPQWDFIQKLVRTVCTSLAEIDQKISPFAVDWPLFRMAVLDRTILRMAVAEMLYFPDIPYEVTIDEAVELAKDYGDTDSGHFVNGILSSIHKSLISSEKEEKVSDAK
jgi:N utilization substance protein B